MRSVIMIGCKHVGSTVRACKTTWSEGLQLVGLQGPIELSVLTLGIVSVRMTMIRFYIISACFFFSLHKSRSITSPSIIRFMSDFDFMAE